MFNQTTASAIRADFIARLLDFFTANGEDCGLTASGTLNFPTVVDGVEGWVEVKVAVPKYSDDEGYQLRTDYTDHLAEMTAKAEAKAKAKAEKIAKAKAEKEAKAKAKEEKGE